MSERVRSSPWRALVAPLLAAVALALVTAAPAGAIVPPKNCGMTTVKGKRYNVKADQLRCSTAKPRARGYLRTHRRPRGYRCRSYSPRSTRIAFRCSRGIRVFFAIRR